MSFSLKMDGSRIAVGGRMRCYVDPDKISARQPDDDESVEKLESDARNHEQVILRSSAI